MKANYINIIPPKANHDKVIANVKNIYLKTKLEILLNNWCVQKINNEYIFFKHFNSNRKGVINQLILSGNDYDGIYEFEIFGHNLKMSTVFDKTINDLVMKVESCSNYDLAVFNKKKNRIIISKKNLSEEDFWKEIKKQLSRLSIFDIVVVNYDNADVIIDQHQLGELKYRKKTYEALKDKEKVKEVQFIQKKKPYYISRLDLGEEEFKRELIQRKLITPEEYDLFTSQNPEICSVIYKNLKKVEII